MITIRLKDGKEKEFESAVSLADAAKAISNSLGKNALVAKVNGELTDLRDPIVDGAEVEFFTKEDPEGRRPLPWQQIAQKSTSCIFRQGP